MVMVARLSRLLLKVAREEGSMKADTELDVVIVGAGFAGLYALYKMRSMGYRVHALEAGSDVGGTWYWNRYPGARCDVPSIEYSFSFDPDLQQEWNWTELMATQPEILAYANHVADRFELRKHIRFNTRVNSACFDESAKSWRVKTDSGDEITARFCIMATGALSEPNMPRVEGYESFKGEVYHTARWPKEPIDLSNKRVGVFGTGSSGIQAIPILAKQSKHLTVLQRTPHFTIPANNKPLTREYIASVKSQYARIREEARHAPEGLCGEKYSFGGREDGRLDESAPSVKDSTIQERARLLDQYGFGAIRMFSDLFTDMEANEMLCELFREQVRRIVNDPKTAEGLLPTGYPMGCKRIAFDTDYYATFNRDNVSLIDFRAEPLECLTSNGIRTTAAEYEFDCLVYATGFDAMTGALMRMEIVGEGGKRLNDYWADGPRSYLGLQVAGFPNLFTITGPGSPSVLSNVMVSIEQHVEWVAECLGYMDAQDYTVIKASGEAENQWVQEANAVASQTSLAAPSCHSWYLGTNISGKPRMMMPYVGGVGEYRAKCDKVAKDDYAGFIFSS